MARLDETIQAGVMLELFGDAGFEAIIERALDVSGSPGTYVVLDRLPAGTPTFFDPVPLDDNLWWYRFKQAAAGYTDSAYGPEVQAASSLHSVSTPIARALVLSDIPRSFSNPTLGSVIVQNVADTGHLASAMQESGGRAVARLLAKPLAGDPDTLDPIADGATYAKVKVVALTTGQVDLSKAGVISKTADYIQRSTGDATPIVTVVQNIANTGHLASGMQESGGKTVARLLAKALAADPDQLDSVADGTTYKRTTTDEKTGAGRGFSALNSSNRLTAGMEGDQNLVGGSLYIEATEAPLIGTVASPSSIEKELYIPGPMFIGKDNAVPWEIHSDGITIYGATATERILWCAILVAPGVELTEIAMRSYRDATAELSLLRIYRVDTDTSTLLATIDDTNTPVSTNRTLTAALSETSTVGRTYILEWDAKTENPSSSPILRWTRLKYRMADYRVSI